MLTQVRPVGLNDSKCILLSGNLVASAGNIEFGGHTSFFEGVSEVEGGQEQGLYTR